MGKIGRGGSYWGYLAGDVYLCGYVGCEWIFYCD